MTISITISILTLLNMLLLVNILGSKMIMGKLGLVRARLSKLMLNSGLFHLYTSAWSNSNILS